MIKETIVVEGKNDAAAVRRAVVADIIITSGFGLKKSTIDLIKTAQSKQGVIVLTDPDFMGEKIREIITKRVPGVKHAYVPRVDATEDGDVGIENAQPSDIIKALSMAKTEIEGYEITFSNMDMFEYGLSGQENSSELRTKTGAILGIGYGNVKQFLNRLNKYGISRDELEQALNNVLKRNEDNEEK